MEPTDTTNSQQHSAPRLARLSLTMFKAFFQQTNIEFKRITLIFGANSAGKSSIIHALLLLHQLQQDTNGGFPHDVRFTTLGGESLDLGGYPHYAFRHQSVLPVGITTTLTHTSISQQLHPTVMTTSTHTTLMSNGVPNLSLPTVMQVTDLEGETLYSTGITGRKNELRRSGSTYFHYYAHSILTDFYREKYLLLIGEIEKRFIDYFTNDEEISRSISRIFDDLRGSPEYLSTFTSNHVNYAGDKPDFRMFRETNGEYYPTFDGMSQMERLVRGALHAVLKQNTALSSIITADQISKLLTPPFTTMQEVLIRYNNDSPLFSSILGNAVTMHEQFLASLRYIGPIRVIPSRYFSNADDTKLSAVDGTLAWEQLSLNPALVNLTNTKLLQLQMAYKLTNKQPSKNYLIDKKYMDQHLEMLSDAYQLSADTLGDLTNKIRRKLAVNTGKPHVELVDLHTNTIVSHRDVGVGVSQVLPILVSAYAESNATICIEQPELHLHPRLQGDLADVFIETSIGSEQNNSYIIETHSEAIIRRLMRRVREGKISKDDISIVYVESGAEGSTVTHIHLDDDGDLIDEWPNGFFEEGFRDNMAGR